MTPRLSGWTIHINIVVILQNLFIMLCLFSESDQLKLPQHYFRYRSGIARSHKWLYLYNCAALRRNLDMHM